MFQDRRSARALGVLVLCAATLTLVAAQNPPAPQGQIPPRFRTGIDLVQVDVHATTKNGPVLDLAQDDVELYENGVLQKLSGFEHIVTRVAGEDRPRTDPRSHAEMSDAVADPRTRLSVVFFDTLHTIGYNSPAALPYDPRVVGRDLASFLHASIGPDDLVALMQPDTPLGALTFTRRPDRFDDYLNSGAEWQKRFMARYSDDVEPLYETCYGPPDFSPITGAMIARRREMRLLDALRALVTWLGALREGRKSVFVVSEGWTLFAPDPSLERPLNGQPPTTPTTIGMPRQPGATGGSRSGDAETYARCERDRVLLARLDHPRDFRRILDTANQAGVTFYPIDIRGLTVSGTFNRKSDALITLATATDGVAVIDTNSFKPVLMRIQQDLASYYLLSYYSTNTKADGTFRKIEVRVKRPGVSVRSRPGYWAQTAAEAAERAARTAVPDADAVEREQALRLLDAPTARESVALTAGVAWRDGRWEGASGSPVAWVVGELDSQAARQPEWSTPRTATVTLTDSKGQSVSGSAMLSATARSFLMYLSDRALALGEEYRVRLAAPGPSSALQDATASARLKLPADRNPLMGTPLLFRAAAGAKAPFTPTAIARYRRNERLRVAVPLGPGSRAMLAELLDRKGQLLPVPVTVSTTTDGGIALAHAELVLLPLSVGDYLIRCVTTVDGRTERRLVAFRIVPA